MDIIELARELGRSIQQDERFAAYDKARSESDADMELQSLIGKFNLKRMSITNEAQKENRNDELLRTLNQELRETYAQIMANPHMAAYNDAKNELDALVQRVTTIITLSAQGEDPATADEQAENCTGDCSTCGGCH